MERLTKRKMDAFGVVRYWTNARKPEAVQRLGEYEDLGTPEELKSAMDRCRWCGWVPVPLFYPNTDEHVLCCTQRKDGSKNIVLGYYDRENDRWVCGMNPRVIAWMPLPNVPGDGGEEDAEG